MHIQLMIRKCGWLLLLPLLAGCGAATIATVSPIATTTVVNMDGFATQIAGTVVAQITQTSYVTPSQTLPPRIPTYTPSPIPTPGPVFSDDGKKKVFTEDGHSFYASDTAPDAKAKQIFDVFALAVQNGSQVRAPTFLKNTHILLFNVYICNEQPYQYPFSSCFVSTYSVNVDTGEIEEIGQRVSGFSADEDNFELSPNQKYLSIAGSGHINIFSFSAGHFKLAYFGAFAYNITTRYEFLPYQYWLPDSSGLIFVTAKAGQSNAPPDPPRFYNFFRYSFGKKAVQIDAMTAARGDAWGMQCIVSFSPDRNWVFFINDNDETIRLGNLSDGHFQEYDELVGAFCDTIAWSPDSKHFAVTNFDLGWMGAVDGSPLIKLTGSFGAWVDATHYTYSTYHVENGKGTSKNYIAEIGGDSILILTPTPTPTPQ